MLESGERISDRVGRDFRSLGVVSGRVFITQPIPEPGPSLVCAGARAVAMNPEDRVLSHEELRAAVAGCDAVLCLLTDRIDAEVLEAAAGCRVLAKLAGG